MFLFWRLWRYFCDTDPLAAAILVQETGRRSVGELTDSQARGMEHLERLGYIRSTGKAGVVEVNGQDEWVDIRVWYPLSSQAEHLGDWMERECRRLGRRRSSYQQSLKRRKCACSPPTASEPSS